VSMGRIADTCRAGDTVELRVGLWRQGIGRLTLQGAMDDEQRVRVGALRLDGQDGQISNAVWTPVELKPDPFLARLNKKDDQIAFGSGTTNGGYRITKDGDALKITPLPDSPRFSISIEAQAVPFGAPKPTRVSALDESGATTSSVPLVEDSGRLTFWCEPGVFAYRLDRRSAP
jgi:hypothetical protein